MTKMARNILKGLDGVNEKLEAILALLSRYTTPVIMGVDRGVDEGSTGKHFEGLAAVKSSPFFRPPAEGLAQTTAKKMFSNIKSATYAIGDLRAPETGAYKFNPVPSSLTSCLRMDLRDIATHVAIQSNTFYIYEIFSDITRPLYRWDDGPECWVLVEQGKEECACTPK